jgi:excisionase family DNA binding protein
MQNPSELLTAGELTAGELSVRLNLPLQTIYALTRQVAIPGYRFGRAVQLRGAAQRRERAARAVAR